MRDWHLNSIHAYTCDMNDDHHWMRQALKQAEIAYKNDEVPIGAIIVANNTLIASGHNQTRSQTDPTAHAEIIALRRAAQIQNNYRLINCELYVTCEPCTMCVGALFEARIRRLIFATHEPKTGAVCSQHELMSYDKHHYNHRISWTSGIEQEAASKLLTDFFRAKRANTNQKTQ